MTYDKNINEVDIQHICLEVLNNCNSFPTIPIKISQEGSERRNEVFKELLNSSLLEISKSDQKKIVIMKAFEIVLEYMDESDIWSTIDYSKSIVTRAYNELKDSWSE